MDIGDKNTHVNNLMKSTQVANDKGILFSCPKHYPIPLTKTMYKKAEKLFDRYYNRTDNSITRKNANVLPTYLAASVGIHYGLARENDSGMTSFYAENDTPRDEYDMVCINSISPENFIKLRNKLS